MSFRRATSLKLKPPIPLSAITSLAAWMQASLRLRSLIDLAMSQIRTRKFGFVDTVYITN